MSVLILGSEGSMGKRYQAILKYLKRDFVCMDREHTAEQVDRAASRASGIIIATPTETHAHLIEVLGVLGKPILCEKPVCKDTKQLSELFRSLRTWGTPFRMMFQYSMLADRSSIGPSLYNYFRHGNDGLIWDCLQVIALARGTCELKEDSPIWSCKLNGRGLNLGHMDAAYIAYMQLWFQKPSQDLGMLTEIHEKVADAEKKVSHGKYH